MTSPRKGLIPLYGQWFLDTSAPVISLNYGPNDGAYWIPLAELRTHSDVLHWIGHMAAKASYPSTDIGDLVRSLRFVLDFDERTDVNPELRAVLSVTNRILPCESDEVLRRAMAATPGYNPDSPFIGYSLGAYCSAELEVLHERHAAGRYKLAPYGRSLIRKSESVTKRRNHDRAALT